MPQRHQFLGWRPWSWVSLIDQVNFTLPPESGFLLNIICHGDHFFIKYALHAVQLFLPFRVMG